MCHCNVCWELWSCCCLAVFGRATNLQRLWSPNRQFTREKLERLHAQFHGIFPATNFHFVHGLMMPDVWAYFTVVSTGKIDAPLQHLQRVVGTSERFAAETHQPFLLWQLFGLCCYCLPHTQQECAQVAVIHQISPVWPNSPVFYSIFMYFHVFSTFNLSLVPGFSSVHSPFGCHFT